MRQPTPPASALVTGGSSGIGRATAHAFARAGVQVVIADIDEEAGNATAEEINAQGGAAHFVRTDVTSPGDVERAVRVTVERHGRLDHAVNNAARTPDVARIVDADVETFRGILEINLTSVLLCLKHQLAQMLEQDGPASVVNIGSIRSFRAQEGAPAYVASKHAVIGLTKSAALECAGTQVRVNAVCPGAIDTPMVRRARTARGESEEDMAARLSLLGRLGTPEEIAEAALWLCSPGASLLTGHSLVADGGYLLR